MGNCVSTIKKKKEPVKSITLAIIGLDNVGKTTLCSVLAGEQPDPDIAPTVGFRNVKMSHSNFHVTIFDLGGGKSIRPIWKTYFGEIYGVMYVLDSCCQSRMSEARDVFKDALEHPQVSGKPVLVMANKVDKEDHMKEVDIVNGLHLEDTVNANNCPSKLVMVSALKGAGKKMDTEIQAGLKWLFDKIRSSLSDLEARVTEDMKTAKEARDKEREERRARVKKQREEREKAEQLERTRLGLGEKRDSGDEDVIDGDPFKALDIEKLKKKEQQLKEQKLQKQERLKELGLEEDRRKKKEFGGRQYAADDSLHSLRSGHRMDLKRFDLSDDPTLRLDDVDPNTSTTSLFGRNTRGSVLPPLEPLGSKSLDLTTSGEKKNRKKKKKLTDYHIQSHNTEKDDRESAVNRLGLSLHEPDYFSRRSDLHDLTPRTVKPKKTRPVMAGRIDEDEEEMDPYKNIGGKYIRGYNDLEGAHQSQKSTNKSKSLNYGDRNDSHLNGHTKDPFDLGRDSSAYKQSLRKISPPNMNRSDDDEKDEGIEQDDSDDSDGVRAYRRAHNQNFSKSRNIYDNRKIRTQERKQQSSDEENDSYAVHNAMKDTLRFPDSPRDADTKNDFRKQIDELRRRHKEDEDKHRSYGGMENGDHKGYSSKHINRHEYNNDHSLSREQPSRNIRSPLGDEDSYHEGRDSNRSDHHRKKKRNLFRSNKLAPSDDEESSARDRFGSPRMVQEHGSRTGSDVDTTPTKNRNSRTTQFHRNVSHDSDFGTKWGLAEDLPAIDNNYGMRRIPNMEDSDDGDVGF